MENRHKSAIVAIVIALLFLALALALNTKAQEAHVIALKSTDAAHDFKYIVPKMESTSGTITLSSPWGNIARCNPQGTICW